jgi:hypothetical protein
MKLRRSGFVVSAFAPRSAFAQSSALCSSLAFAPKGRSVVVTGEAQRNPWSATAPAGAEELSTRRLRALLVVALLILSSCTRTDSPSSVTNDLVPPSTHAATLPATPASRSFHDFVPSLHGFQFRNGFQGSFLGSSESVFGLCGGMSFAAADYFLARRDVPPDTHPPTQGTSLYNFIYSRQATSFGTLGVMGLKFGEWMQLPDDGPDSTHSRTLVEVPYITETLSRGEPVVLGLVLVSTKAGGKAWDNHQVLAFSSTDPAPTRTSLRVYDSNFPGRDDITISITRAHTSIAMHIPGRPDMPIRGIFRMAYSPVNPPN